MKGARGRLSYANVMSTLAVFLAIGGSAVAVSQINGNRLVDRSVGGKKLKKETVAGANLKGNTVTGKQVKESTLGKVPSAKSADASTSAGSANTATTATTAITANDSLALGGLPPSAYQKSSSAKVLAGSAPLDAARPQRLFRSAWRDLGVAAGGGRVRVANEGRSRDLIGTTYARSGRPQRFRLAAGTSRAIGPAASRAPNAVDTVVSEAGRPGRSVWVHCLTGAAKGAPRAFCWGLDAG